MNKNSFSEALLSWSGIFARRTIHDFLIFAHDQELSMPQINILMGLYYRGPASILELRKEMYGSRAAATQTIDKLVQMELVDRSESLEDRRVKSVRLTEKGTVLVQQGIAARRQWMASFAELFTLEEQELFTSVLSRLTNAAVAVEKSGGESKE